MIADYIIIILVSLIASVVGSICGIGGGVIIKPALDSLGIMSVNTISFLSGFTVLCMSTYSVIMGSGAAKNKIKNKIKFPITLGAVVGGVVGKVIYNAMLSQFTDTNSIGAIQAGCLFVLSLGTLIYTLNKKKIRTYNVTSKTICIIAGIMLGFFSSFLGIGGGPFNLVLLSFLFSLEIKEAAFTSLFIIMFSQFASLCITVISNQVPSFNVMILTGMALSGIFGAAIGRKINQKIDSVWVNKLFNILIVIIMMICIYNFFKYL